MPVAGINLFNYRAFLNLNDKEKDKYFIDLQGGENLLIYGENGSGKSSLYKAFKDFIESSKNRHLTFEVNKFYDEQKVTDKPFISVNFTEDPVDYYFSLDKSLTNTDTCSHVDNVIRSSFLSYKELLKLHLFDDKKEINYFNFFFFNDGLFANDYLLTSVDPSNKLTYSQLLKKIIDTQDEAAIDDYNINAVALLKAIEKNTRVLIKYFDENIRLEIQYKEIKLENGKVLEPEISFKVELFEEELPLHHIFLNEARLTSLAISIYFSYLLTVPDNTFRFLFLDDIFIGLDTSNRFPLLDIITSRDLGENLTFSNFQIFLTTYDREWYELCKNVLKENWKSIELYVDGETTSVERPILKNSKNHFESATFHFITGDYPASANYLRKEVERLLRLIIPVNELYGNFREGNEEGSIITISKQELNISENTDSWFFKKSGNINEVYTGIKFIGLETLISKFEGIINFYKIPFIKISDLRSIKNRLLNPLSHNDLKTQIYKRELLTAFEVVKELAKIKTKLIIDLTKDSNLLLAAKKNYEGCLYYYRFELLENLIYLEYQGFRMFFNAKTKSLYKQWNNRSFEVREHEYPSLQKICKTIFYDATKPIERENLAYDYDYEFQEVFDESGKKLIELI